MLIDTQIQLYSKKFEYDLESVIERARSEGVEILLVPGIDVPTTERAIELARRYPGHVYAMAAIHPSETREVGEEQFDAIRTLCEVQEVVAVGETGLDYYWDRSFDDTQQAAFRTHIQSSLQMDLPLVLHSRDKKDRWEVHEDMVRILDDERAASDFPERLRGVFHCFGGPDWLPGEAEKLGFMLGIGGTLTFRNSGVAELLEDVPLSQIILETDAPYLAPVPHRGRRNEPAYVRLVASHLSGIKGVPVQEIERVTTANAQRLFGLDAGGPSSSY